MMCSPLFAYVLFRAMPFRRGPISRNRTLFKVMFQENKFVFPNQEDLEGPVSKQKGT
jgi:hypothetical protein